MQWEILRTAFHGHRTLVLIGDPKQAIYAFRGARRRHLPARARRGGHRGDARAQLAQRRAGAHRPRPRCSARRRSATPASSSGRSTARARGRRLDGAPAVRLRQVTRAALGLKGVKNPKVGEVRDLLYADVAAEVVRSLQTSRLRDGGAWRPLQPGRHRGARPAATPTRRPSARRSPTPASPPSSPACPACSPRRPPGTGSSLLTALSQPGHSGRVAAAALTRVRRLGRATARGGRRAGPRRARRTGCGRGRTCSTSAASRRCSRQRERRAGSPSGCCARPTGERDAHRPAAHRAGAARGGRRRAARHRRAHRVAARPASPRPSRTTPRSAAAASRPTPPRSRSSRSTRARAWSSPSCTCRSRGTGSWTGPRRLLRYHDDDGARLLHVGGAGSPGYDDARTRHLAEEFGEDLRLAYVALTRASSQVVAWWAPSTNSAAAPLTRLLLGGHAAGEEPPHDRQGARRRRCRGRASTPSRPGPAGTVVHEVVDVPVDAGRWAPPAADRADLTVGRFGRRLDPTWRRTSYSGLTAAAHDGVGVERARGHRHPGRAGPGRRGADPPPGAAGAAAGFPGPRADAGRPGTASTTGEPERDRRGTADGRSRPWPAASRTGRRRRPRAGRRCRRRGRDGGTPDLDRGGLDSSAALRAIPSPMSDLPGGTAFGTLVHEVLEHVDTDTGDLAAELLRHCREAALSRGLGVDPDALADGTRARHGDAARRPRGRADARRASARPTGSPSSRSSCRSPAVTSRVAAPRRCARSAPSCAGTCRPTTRSRRTRTASAGRGPARRAAARLPHRVHRRRPARDATADGGPAVPRRRLQDQPARARRPSR